MQFNKQLLNKNVLSLSAIKCSLFHFWSQDFITNRAPNWGIGPTAMLNMKQNNSKTLWKKLQRRLRQNNNRSWMECNTKICTNQTYWYLLLWRYRKEHLFITSESFGQGDQTQPPPVEGAIQQLSMARPTPWLIGTKKTSRFYPSYIRSSVLVHWRDDD